MNISQQYFQIISNKKLHHNPKSFKVYLQKLYKGVDFKGKKVLEIGAGNGFHSFYTAYCGAEKVVSIEPEADGAQNGFLNDFKKNSELFKMDSVSLFAGTLQNFESGNEKFDIIISHYSVNHLNEKACESLRSNSNSKNIYIEIFNKLHGLLEKKGKIIIVDCSNSNLFTKIGTKNPFAPSIEWEKHQNPSVWINLLEQVGFKKEKLMWLPPYQLQNLGYFFLSNKVGSFLTHGHFAIFMGK